MGAETNLLLVHGEVHEAAGEGEEWFAGIAVVLVLADRVLNALTGEIVLELEGGHR